MSAAVTCTPTAPVHGASSCRIDVTGATVNDSTAYDANVYPTEPEVRYYIAFLLSSTERNRSYRFAPASDGTHSFDNFMFDTAGTWTVNLNKVSDDSTAATLSVTVS